MCATICFTDTSSMPFYSWFIFIQQCFVLKHLLRPSAWWSPLFRWFYNRLMLLALFLLEKYPLTATWTFGKQNAKIKIFPSHID